MPFDYKKAYPEYYLPPRAPGIAAIPAMEFLAVEGRGDPNREGGDYKAAVGLLYAVAYTIKMSKLGASRPEGYFDYVVPPLEGLWQMEGPGGVDLARKERFRWTALIRLPEFVTGEAFDRAVREAGEKKKLDCSRVKRFPYEEGLCVQCMHLGPYDSEGETIRAMEEYARAQGYSLDYSEARRHHEIYLSDPRRARPERLKTVIRLPVRKGP